MVPSDKRARVVRILAVVACLALIVSARWVADFVTSAGIDHADLKKATAQLIFRAKLATVALAIGFAALALFCAREGFTIMRARSYPPPGVKVLWRVRKKSGRSALLIGLWHQAMAALLLLIAASGFWFWFWLWPRNGPFGT